MLPTTEGGSSSSSQVDATLSRAAAGAVLNAVVGTATDVLGIGANLKVALCSSAPAVNIADGTWDLSAAELTDVLAPGYARATVPRATGFVAPAGAAPVHADTVDQVLFPLAGADWPAVTHVALLDNAGTVVLTVFELTAPILVLAGKQARIPAGSLSFTHPWI
jgi:hypothetical protein